MATYGEIEYTTSNGRYYHRLFAQVVSQDVTANTTTVYYQYGVYSQTSYANGAWTTLNNVTFEATVNGVSHTATPNFDFRVNKTLIAVEGYQTINNDSDGTLEISLALDCNQLPLSIYFLAASAADSNALIAPTLPRASTFTVTPNPVFPSGEVLINITRAVGTFVHDITWESGVESGTIDTDVATSATWTPDPDLLDGGLQVAITITVQTKTAGGVAIGSPVSYDLILKALPEYPEIGVGTPYDLRIRRAEYDSGEIVVKESIPYIDAQFVDTLSASGSLNLTVQEEIYETNLDEAVVVVDMYDGSQWLDNGFIFVLTRTEADEVDETHAVKYTGLSYVDYLLSKNLAAADYDWPVTNPGDIIHQYITLGKGRGWGPLIERSFTQTKTTLNTAWQNTTDISASKNTPVSQILDGFVNDILVEYRSYYDRTTGKAYLDMFNPGYGSDWTVQGATPIINLATTLLWKVGDKAPVRKDFSEKLTRVNVTGDETSTTRESAAAVNPLFGHLEGSVDATGVTTVDKLNELGDAVLVSNGTATVERTYSYDLSSTQTPDALYPYRTFRPGDYLLAPGDDGLERVRVSQVAIKRDADGTTATITIGDLIPNGVAATARKLAQAGGGAIAGGTMLSPLPLSSAIPQAPEILDAVPDAYWDVNGVPQAGVFVTWTPVSQSLNGTDITVDQYELWSRLEVGAPWSLALLSDIPEGTIAPTLINSTLDLRVRARSASGIYGPYSDEWNVVTSEPGVDIEGPDLADLYTDGVGNIFAVWGGTLDGDPAPARLAYVTAEISDDDGATYVPMGTPIVAAGTIVLNPEAWGEFLVRLRGYDTLGNAGDASDPEAIALTDPHIDPPRPATPTGLAATPGVGWDASGYFPIAWFDLEWDAVTEDLLANDITVVGYDVWGQNQNELIQHFIASSATNSVRVFAVQGDTWTFKVRASSNFGGVSDFSDTVTEDADASPDAPVAPDAPTLEQYAGILRIKWSGNGMVPSIKYAYALISTDDATYTRAGMPLTGSGEVVVPGLAPTDYYAKIAVVDELGQVSLSDAAGPITLLPITGVTIQTNALPYTGIKLTDAALTAYDAAGVPTFILDAGTGEVWIAPYDAVFEFGATGVTAQSGTPTTGLQVSSENSSFNTFFYPGGVQIRNDQTALSWWEADSTDANLVNFFSPRAVIGQRLRVGDFEFQREAKSTGTRLVMRYKGA